VKLRSLLLTTLIRVALSGADDALATIGHDDVISIGHDVLALPPLDGIARSVALPRRAMTRAT
jgi:hypothetical protein